MRASNNDLFSNGRLVGDHKRLIVVTLNSRFTRSRGRAVCILVHLFQRLQKIICTQLLLEPYLLDRFHVPKITLSPGHGKGFPETVWTVIGARPPSRRDGEL